MCSGDGTLSAFDLRQKKLEQRSDQSESELLSLAIVKVREVHTLLPLGFDLELSIAC